MLARLAVLALHPRRRDDDDIVALHFRPRHLRALVEPQAGEQQHPVGGTDGVLDAPGRAPERDQLHVRQAAAARLRLADDLGADQPVAWRVIKPVDVLIDAPVEKPLDHDQQPARRVWRGALLRVDDFQHVELGDFADRSVAPCGDEVGAEVALHRLAAPLLRQLVPDESLGGVAERVPDAQRPLTVCLLTRLGLDTGRVEALGDQAAPLACGASRLLQGNRAVGADDAARRCRTRREPGSTAGTRCDRPCRAAPGRHRRCR